MGHCYCFLRAPGLGLDLLLYLDDLVFAVNFATAACSLSAVRTLLNKPRNLGRLVNEAKCKGTSEALQIFTTLADDTNWLFSPIPLIGRALRVNHARASGARGILVVPLSPCLRPRGRWIPEISEALLLGAPDECLRLPAS